MLQGYPMQSPSAALEWRWWTMGFVPCLMAPWGHFIHPVVTQMAPDAHAWWTWSQCNIVTVGFYIWTSPPVSVSSAPLLLADSIFFIMRWTVPCKTSFTASGLHRWWDSMQISVAFFGNMPALGGCVEKSVEDDAGCSLGIVSGRLSSHTLRPHHCFWHVTTPRSLVRTFGDFVIWPWLILLPSSPRMSHSHDQCAPALIKKTRFREDRKFQQITITTVLWLLILIFFCPGLCWV